MRPVMQKAHDYENKTLTALARKVPCRFTFAHRCEGDSMACHANWLAWNKAVGKKAPDWAWAAGCLAAHDAIDNKLNKTLTYDQREYEWMNAYLGTWNYIWSNKLVRVA
jgi:hypothetical protein